MRDVAVIGYARAQMPCARDLNEVEILMPVLGQALADAGLAREEIDFICSGSCDYLAGGAFSFVMAVDSLGATPCAVESHVEMDAAWALYEAWLKFQCGEIDTALIYGFGKSSPGALPEILSQQLDPYYLAPLWPDSISLAALQADALLASGRYGERDLAAVVADSRARALELADAHLKGRYSVEQLLAEPPLASPLRRHDCCPISDGASVLILASREVAQRVCPHPAWIRGIDHRMEPHQLGLRDLTTSVSTALAGQHAGVANGPVDVAELYAPFSHQQLILRDALGLDADTVINPSGGVLAGHVMMAAGLDRFGEVFRRLRGGEARRGVAHATSGPCLQHNLVAVLEAEHG